MASEGTGGVERGVAGWAAGGLWSVEVGGRGRASVRGEEGGGVSWRWGVRVARQGG